MQQENLLSLKIDRTRRSLGEYCWQLYERFEFVGCVLLTQHTEIVFVLQTRHLVSTRQEMHWPRLFTSKSLMCAFPQTWVSWSSKKHSRYSTMNHFKHQNWTRPQTSPQSLHKHSTECQSKPIYWNSLLSPPPTHLKVLSNLTKCQLKLGTFPSNL